MSTSSGLKVMQGAKGHARGIGPAFDWSCVINRKFPYPNDQSGQSLCWDHVESYDTVSEQ